MVNLMPPIKVIPTGVKDDLYGQPLHMTSHYILFGPPLLQLIVLDLHNNHTTPSLVH